VFELVADENVPTPVVEVRGVVRIDSAYDSLENQLEWLEGWI